MEPQNSDQVVKLRYMQGGGKPERAAPEGAASFIPGRDLAVTKVSIVYRNRLIELIQYAPLTDKVRPEPILIVPAWLEWLADLSGNRAAPPPMGCKDVMSIIDAPGACVLQK